MRTQLFVSPFVRSFIQELVQIKQNIRSRKKSIANKKDMLETLRNHKEMERKIDSARRQAHKLQYQLKEKEFAFNQFEKEVSFSTLLYTECFSLMPPC